MIGDNLYLWGGNDVPQVHNNDEKTRLTSQIAIFSITSGVWNSRPTNGSPPLGVKGYSCTSSNDKIYFFGGWCSHDHCYHNSLNELDISTLTWTQLQSTDDSIKVMKRGYGGIMSSEQEGHHYLLFIGGHGSPPSTQLSDVQYYQLPSGIARTNEQNIYDLKTGNNINIILYILYILYYHISLISVNVTNYKVLIVNISISMYVIAYNSILLNESLLYLLLKYNTFCHVYYNIQSLLSILTITRCILFVFLLGQWIIPEIIGQCMPPAACFVMEAVNNTRAIIFGGIVENIVSNSLYILDIINRTVVSYIIIHTLTDNMLYNEC